MPDTKIHVHYNGDWERKHDNDTYTGDIKKKVVDLHGFEQGPDFEVYGLVLVEITGCRRRILIAGEETLNTYVEEACRVPALFIIASQKVKIYRAPTTPTTSIVSNVCQNTHTPTIPLNPASNNGLSSSVAENSSIVRYNLNGAGTDTEYVPKDRISLGVTWERPSPIESPHLHNVPSTPKPMRDSSPPERYKELKWYELCQEYFETKTTLSHPNSIRFICKDINKECRWAVTAKRMPSLRWWEITKVAAPHNFCKETNMNPLVRKKTMARQMTILFREEFAKCDCAYSPRKLIEDMMRDYSIDISYRQAYAGWNIIKKFHKVAAAEAFIRATKAYIDDDYRKTMSEIKNDKEVLSYVRKVSSRFWDRISCQITPFYSHNIYKSCNALLLKARTLPITHLVDFIRS
ncbi:hypothetical protein MKX01_014246 [Papaver californicum]|nr:hypothetical protein MKX01_014246 [Papaver californicum]